MNLSFFVLPHQDDETFLIPKIASTISGTSKPYILFLTRSKVSDTLASIREAESLYFLRRLGVSQNEVHFLGRQLNVLDGSVDQHFEKLVSAITTIVNGLLRDPNSKIEFISPAYEGGHHDHDAAFLISKILSKRFSAETYEVFLYNGHRTVGRFYRVASPFGPGEYISYPYSFRDLRHLMSVPIIFASQRSAMLGLWPFLFGKALFSPLKLRRSTSIQNIIELKHPVTPMYERWGRTTQSAFLSSVKIYFGDLTASSSSSETQQDKSELREELTHFHSQIFGFEPGEIMLEHYVTAHSKIVLSPKTEELTSIRKIVNRKLPLGPIELSLRRKMPVLSKKVNLIVYLAETINDYNSKFEVAPPGRLKSILKLITMIFELPVTYFYGKLLVIIYGI